MIPLPKGGYDFVSLPDMHSGSVFGLWHPDFKLKDGSKHSLNEMQEWLWKYWNIMCIELTKDPPDACIVPGDAVDGVQRRAYGRRLVTADMDDQRKNAAMLYRMVPLKHHWGESKEFGPYYVSCGTDYHEALTNTIHDTLCEDLVGKGCVDEHGWPATVGQSAADYYWLDTLGDLHVGDFVINVAHGSSSAFVQIETPISRERTFMLNASELQKASYADLILRAHTHVFNQIEVAGARQLPFPTLEMPAVVSLKTVICPSFQGQTEYMRKKSPYKLIPDIGYVQIHVDEFGVHVRDRIFPPLILKGIERFVEAKPSQTNNRKRAK